MRQEYVKNAAAIAAFSLISRVYDFHSMMCHLSSSLNDTNNYSALVGSNIFDFQEYYWRTKPCATYMYELMVVVIC